MEDQFLDDDRYSRHYHPFAHLNSKIVYEDDTETTHDVAVCDCDDCIEERVQNYLNTVEEYDIKGDR